MSKPRLSFGQILNMSVGFFGIQFGFALQNANVSRIFQTLGADMESISILWLAAPVTGLIVQPIVGHYSDRTWGRLGRRRPYFLFGAIAASLALISFPNSPALWFAAGMLWIMDASINISMEPFRAYVGDMLPYEQRTKGFAAQSFFIGLGAVVASMLPFLLSKVFGISSAEGDAGIPPQVKWSFYIGAAAFLGAVLYTVVRTKEYSPEQMAAFNEENGQPEDEGVNTGVLPEGGWYVRKGSLWLLGGMVLAVILLLLGSDLRFFIIPAMPVILGVATLISGSLVKRKADAGIIHMVTDLFRMPATMRQLAWVQFFSWFALFCMWLYTTATVTLHIWGTDDTTSVAFNEGADWVGNMFAVYNGVAAVVAFILPVIARRIGRKQTHALALLIGGLGLVSLFWIRDQYLLLVSMVGVGIAWASILSMPYAILSGSIPQQKMGIYMGIFNFFIVIPQILAAAILGSAVARLFGNDPVWVLVSGGISLGIAAILSLMVRDIDEERRLR